MLFVLTISKIGHQVMVIASIGSLHIDYRKYLSFYRAKLGQGLLSGEYSREISEEPEEVKEPTIRVCLTTLCMY